MFHTELNWLVPLRVIKVLKITKADFYRSPRLWVQVNPINPGLLALELTLGGSVFHPPAIKQEPLKLEG